MSFVLGVVLFALGIGLSVALHEAGHMYTAKAFGMKVRRYFIGFGPTVFSFRRGETEYGLKAIPAGGFCDIAGMTALDELPDPADRKRAFYRFATWKRVVVMAAGIATNFALAIVIIYVMAVSTGLPNQNPPPTPAVIAQLSDCAGATDGSCPAGAPSPARDAGLEPGDRIVAVAGNPVSNFDELTAITQRNIGPTEFVVERNGARRALIVDVAPVPAAAFGGTGTEPVGAIGVNVQSPDYPRTLEYGPVDAVGQTFFFTGTMFENTWEGLKQFPQKVPLLIDRIQGEDRLDTPISVVGASVLGGDAVDAGLWVFFLYLLAALNLFLGVFNLLPLLPLDGGHIVVNVYERVRNWFRGLRGLRAGPPVDYTRLLPLTYAVMLVFIAVAGLTITADIVNPIRLPVQ